MDEKLKACRWGKNYMEEYTFLDFRGNEVHNMLYLPLCDCLLEAKPVCVQAEGVPLVEDVGGLHGYTAFLRAIHPTEERSYWAEHPEEQRPDKGPFETKQESLAWAKGLGWKDKVRVETLM